jgi:hypothetical protein
VQSLPPTGESNCFCASAESGIAVFAAASSAAVAFVCGIGGNLHRMGADQP